MYSLGNKEVRYEALLLAPARSLRHGGRVRDRQLEDRAAQPRGQRRRTRHGGELRADDRRGRRHGGPRASPERGEAQDPDAGDGRRRQGREPDGQRQHEPGHRERLGRADAPRLLRELREGIPELGATRRKVAAAEPPARLGQRDLGHRAQPGWVSGLTRAG